jgi:hypothetical protein
MASDRNINILNEMTQENTNAVQRMVDPIVRLNQSTGDLASVQSDNLNEVRYLRNTILQQNNFANKLKDSITKADKINTKALGQSITLRNIVDKNSAAVEQSRVGYLRAAEMFVDNFAAGIRQTTGGTLKLSEQLILTGQDLNSFRNVNNRLLSQSGKNYDAIGDFNDAILETADTYVISTDTLLKGVEKLMKDIDQFSLFGPDVAEKIAAATADTTGKLAGLNNEALQSFFKLLKPGLEGRATRELLGLQELQEQLAGGDVDGDMIANSIMDVGRQLESIVAGRTPDVGVELLKARGLSPEDSAALIGAYRTLQAGGKTSKSMLATQEEQTKTLKNQAELASKYYERIAPLTLMATTALYAPILQTAQLMNVVAAGLTLKSSVGNLAGLPGNRSGNPTLTPVNLSNQNILSQKTLSNQAIAQTQAIQNQTKTLGQRFSEGMGRVGNHIKGGFGSLKEAVSKPGRLVRSPVGLGGLAIGSHLISNQLGDEGAQGAIGRGLGEFSNAAGMVSMAQTLIPKFNPLSVGGGIGLAVASLADSVDELAGFEQGGTGDFFTDAAKYAGYGATIGSIIPGLGTGIGAAVGGAVGLIAESFDFDGDRKIRKAQLEELKKQNEAKEREAMQLLRAKNSKSDFALMALVNKVQERQSALLDAGNQKTLDALEALTEAVQAGNRDRKIIDAGRGSKDLNK